MLLSRGWDAVKASSEASQRRQGYTPTFCRTIKWGRGGRRAARASPSCTNLSESGAYKNNSTDHQTAVIITPPRLDVVAGHAVAPSESPVVEHKASHTSFREGFRVFLQPHILTRPQVKQPAGREANRCARTWCLLASGYDTYGAKQGWAHCDGLKRQILWVIFSQVGDNATRAYPHGLQTSPNGRSVAEMSTPSESGLTNKSAAIPLCSLMKLEFAKQTFMSSPFGRPSRVP